MTPSMQGLIAAEVAQRVRAGQTNAYTQATSRSLTQILRANVATIFNAILAIALVLILLVGSPVDALFGFVLLLNTATGTLAEIRAKRALDRLTVLDAPRAHVIRDGQRQDIDISEVVLDDLLELRAGEQIPADGTLVTCVGLEVDESILTGESDAVRPSVDDQVMSGTTVTAGTALMRATAVGAQAYAHRLATEARRYSLVVSELQSGTNRILRWMSWVIVPMGLLVFWSQMRLHGGTQAAFSSGQWTVALVAGVAGVVGMVPQGLVLLTSVNFATAALSLARRHVLVQELPAVEVLARVDTLCLDKTGTLTTGRMALSQVLPLGEGQDEAASRGCNGVVATITDSAALTLGNGAAVVPAHLRDPLTALAGSGEPNATARAILTGINDDAASALTITDAMHGDDGMMTADLSVRCRGAIPFSSTRKWSGIILEETAWVMGAPEIVLRDVPHSERYLARARDLAAGGMRVVAVASSSHLWTDASSGFATSATTAAGAGMAHEDYSLPAELQAVALVILSEDIRPDAARTLHYFREQGVDVKIISGDNPDTVAAVAARAGVRTEKDDDSLTALDARTLPRTADDPDDCRILAEAITHAQVLGRVTPEQKKAVVQALHLCGRTVAMTGDGVNDALALKEADLGIAMGNGAPATKAVARMVLLSGEFSTLPGVVAQGRRVMANTERIASLFLTKTVYASFIALIVSICAMNYPFLPRQLTIVSSLTIGIPAFILALAPNTQRYRPGFLPRVLALSVPAGLVAGATTLSAQYWLSHVGLPADQVTTGATIVLVSCGLTVLTLTARPLWGWRLGLIIAMGCFAVIGVVVAPIREFFLVAWPRPSTWIFIALHAVVAIVAMTGVGMLRRRYHRSSM